jgi:exocyst complex component 2
LETWALSSSEPYTTEYLSDIQFFQRQVTTWAFKFASEASPRLARRPVPNEFVIKITRVFLDAAYAFLDGLVYLVEEGSPVTDAEKFPATGVIDAAVTGKLHPLGLLDTSDMVS